MLILCLSLTLTSCFSVVTSSDTAPVNASTGVDICKLDLQIFKLDENEKLVMRITNKRNAGKLNCVLHKRCGRPYEKGDKCED